MSRTHHARGVSKHRRSRWKHWLVRRTKPLERTHLDRPADARDYIDPEEIASEFYNYLEFDNFPMKRLVRRLRVAMADVLRIT
jgi:hypothetical protein